MLEALNYTDNCFATLTYDPAHFPSDGSLQPKELQDWLKRFRKALAPHKIRYFLVGEYGDQTQRPHYHVALFNYPTCRLGNSDLALPRRCACSSCKTISDTWGKGNVHLGQLTPESSQYIAGYVTKKMTSKDDVRLSGRHPEYARMSLKPGIGADFMAEYASTLMTINYSKDDVPSSIRHGPRLLPLGRYLRRKLRQQMGMDPNAPPSTIAEVQKELQPLLKASIQNTTSFKAELVNDGTQKVTQMEARQCIWKPNRGM